VTALQRLEAVDDLHGAFPKEKRAGKAPTRGN
jgi:hypothetical protein